MGLGPVAKWFDDAFEWGMERMAAVIIVTLAALIFGTAAVAIVSGTSPAFTLKKAEWNCTSSHHEFNAPTYVKSGDSMIPVGGGDEKVCDRYERVSKP